MPPVSRRTQLRRVAEAFQEKAIALATGVNVSYEDWESARDELINQPELVRNLPEWILSHRSGSHFWQFMKQTSPTYAGRREFIWSSLSPVFDSIERGATQPTAIALEALLVTCSSASVGEAWSRIQARRGSDPEGMITAARSLLESTCKYILDELGLEYGDADDLPKLYGQTAKAMSLSPADHTEQVFKQILAGCYSVVNGMAALRNAFGDAHGKGKKQPKPAARHADLAANLAGSMAAFLIATYEDRVKAKVK